MITAADAGLLEREQELEALRAVLADAREGRGAVTVVAAPPGHGKTALLRVLRDEAQGAGMRVLHAAGAELERDFAFGITDQLFRSGGSTRRGREWLELKAGECRFHSLYDLASRLALQQPRAIVCDDVHWTDAGSLKALGVLVQHIAAHRIALVVAQRPVDHADEPLVTSGSASPCIAANAPLLEALGRGAPVLSLPPLSRDAVG